MPNDGFEFTIDLDSLSERIDTQRATCEQFLHARRKRLETVQHGLFENLKKISDQYSDWENYRTETEKQQIDLENESQALQRDRDDLEARALELEKTALHTEEQRKRIANKTKEQREQISSANANEIVELQAAVDSSQSEIDAHIEKRNTLEAEVAALCEQLERAKEREQDLKARATKGIRIANERGKQIENLHDQLKAESQSGTDATALKRIQAERDSLAADIRILQQQLEEQEGSVDSEEFEKLKHEFENLKRSNESLKTQLQSNQDRTDVDDGLSDWERRKHEMLQTLSADDVDLEAHQQARVDAAIQETDRVVSAKDAQIAELQSKLEKLVKMVEANQVQQPNQPSVHDDEQIQAEQQRLKDLQAQWEQKICQAEVDIAVQRAKFARQKSELEEKARDVEAQLALAKKQVALHAKDAGKKKKGWLNR